ncbi:hypothetical protein DLAC_03949 [Tieghemostelium lacteum]|uniref:Extradiol ring-cleavage dioxygenase class III enzyme subunit B domain-containing protein n=1 Tax=Tieghemostelium lacteum TaxID=361077 RepID=A0A151ZRN8_TIELA|nr:hypothetical protein DLAC_03949 [Tieghemostelium lacteum]|eukprot:KYQ96663.1 hypothetical protein DLAC_03949 [Tieghemostelium lacteum]
MKLTLALLSFLILFLSYNNNIFQLFHPEVSGSSTTSSEESISEQIKNMSTTVLGKRLPSLFISHGAPNLVIDKSDPTRTFLMGLAKSVLGEYERPKGIVCISAHWEEKDFTLTTAEQLDVIYDFYGFENEMYQQKYPSKTSGDLIEAVRNAFNKAKITLKEDSKRGLDHGAWVPLKLIYPQADIPIVQLSLKQSLEAREHFELGRALAPLRDQGYLVLASGGSVHNLRALFDPSSNRDPSWAVKFEDWLKSTLTEKTSLERKNELLNYKDLPFTAQAHPRVEHFVPILVAAGASNENSQGKRIFDFWKTPVFSVSSYQFLD